MERNSRNRKQEEDIFRALYWAKTEKEVDTVLEQYSHIFGTNQNWYPLGAMTVISA